MIQNLKKKVVEQTRVIKMKEKNDEKIIKLDNEIKVRISPAKKVSS